MESAFAWLDRILTFVGRFIPQPYIIKVTERTVLFRFGKRIILKGPGLHWHWPITSPIETMEVVEQAREFNPAVLTTKDCRTVAVGFTLLYEIEDLIVALTKTDSVLQTVGELGEAAIASVIASHTFDELLAEIGNQDKLHRGAFNKKLTRSVRRLVRKYGIKVKSCRIGNFAECYVVRLIQSTA